MPALHQVRFPARLGGVCLVSLLIPVAQADALDPHASAPGAGGGPDDPIDGVLPFELQASCFHSLPIAGLLVTPDQVAQLLLTNPRLRVTTGADTHADLIGRNVRGAGRAAKP
ncbi:MAG: hypothetical protein ACRETI_05425 [Steroidobacteraceae bacterium]